MYQCSMNCYRSFTPLLNFMTPNIIIIISDQHNPHVMGCAENSIVQTPNLDTLARRGTRFRNAYCPYPLCAPSRSGFMSAQYPSDVGVYDNSGSLSFDTPTFAHAFGAAGYEAVLCGRMHFRNPDQFHGFEKRIHADCGGLSAEILGSGYNRTTGQTKYGVQVSGHGETGYRYFDKSVTETACKFIADRQNSDRPYALVVGYMNPHNPLICGREDFEYYMAQIPPLEPESPEYLNALHPAMKKWRERRGVEDITPEQNRRGLAAYYGLTTELDRYIGQIIDTVQSSPDADNTVIIYTSDHGDMAHEHGMWWKSSFYEGSVGIPLICSWPGHLRENHTEDAIVSLIDAGPTALDIAGADPMPDVSGKSFASFLTGTPPPDWPNEVFAEYIGLLGDQPACMLRTGPWKLNYYSEFDSCQLFNIDEDPEERRDLSNDPRYRDVIQSGLKKIFARWSADDILKQTERQARARALIASCGHSHIPHTIPPFAPDIDAVNEFDFSQLPEDPR